MAGTLDTAGLLDLLHAGDAVILPNLRAADLLRQAFDTAQRAGGLSAWEPPPVHDWNTWIGALWSRLILQGADDRLMLNRLQEEMLWAEIIAASPSAATLTSGAQRDLAQLAASASDLCAEHHADDHVQRTADTYDSRAFAEWHATFRARCREEKLISRSRLQAAVADHLMAGHVRLPQVVHLAGFERKTPAQTRFLQELSGGGARLFEHRIVTSGSLLEPLRLVACPDPWQEARWAIRWAGAHLRGADRGGRTVALVIPDPAAERAELQPLLRELLAPELENVGVDLSSTPWQFSAGSPLAAVPSVRHALTLLRWSQGELPLEQISELLLSPNFTQGSTLDERSSFDTQVLRRTRGLRPELALSDFLQLSRHEGRRGAKHLEVDGFDGFSRLAVDALASHGLGSYADWAELTRRSLRAAGWPGERILTAAEFRGTEAWDGLLDLLSTLDFGGRRIRFRDFLETLEREVADQQVSDPSSGSLPFTPPVTILRLSETEGCTFDATILLHSTDGDLPRAERLHPLLGRRLQQSLELPGADASMTRRRVRAQLEDLRDRSQRMLLTWPEADENGSFRPSPLAFDLGAQPVSADTFSQPGDPEEPVSLELVKTSPVQLPLAARTVSGGARVLELQAACGFRAFASLRLKADAPENGRLGMDARDRGSVLHRALEFFWAEVKSQAALRNLSYDERKSTLRRCVQRAFERQRSTIAPADTWALSFLALSEERLVRLLEHWLHFELKRGDFTVLPPEQEQLVTIGPLELTVRPDRIDQVEGGFVFVDYKTSFDLQTSHWLGERPDAPQLPLYTLLREAENVRGVAFAQLRPGQKMGWVGLQKEHGDIHADAKTRLHDLPSQTQAWREELSRLAQAFAEGVTDVDPKSYPHTCRFCEQRLLCRIDTSALLAQDDEDPAGDGKHDG